MKKEKWRVKLKRDIALGLACIIMTTTIATPAYAVYSYYAPESLTSAEKAIKEWSWSAKSEADALEKGLQPTGLSQEQTAIMGGYTTTFWFQDQKAKTISIEKDGKMVEVDLSRFNHRYFTCADSHSTGWFTPAGSQLAFKKLYFPTDNIDDYPQFVQKAPTDMETRKFILLIISLISSAYDTPSLEELKDSDKSSMYYYLLWASIWGNDKYVDQGMFTGQSPEGDWDFVQKFVREIWAEKLKPDVWGSTAIYDAFRDGGPAEKYFFSCWKAAKFLSSFDYTTDIGTSLSASDPVLGEDGMYHMTFDYSSLSDYEKEVYRRLTADGLASGWEYTNDGSTMDFKSPDGKTDGSAVAVLHLQENSDEDRFYNCGFGFGGLAGFQGGAKGRNGKLSWGNTQVYFSAVAEPLEILVGGGRIPSDGEGSFDIEIHRYEHSELWETNYNVQLRKYDAETGQPLENSKWDILESFDADQLNGTNLESSDNWANQGSSQFKKWDGWDYGDGYPDGDADNDPCPWDINVTNKDGLLMLGDNEENASEQKAHTDTKNYTYTKGYCGGHPEPTIEESGDPKVDAELEASAQEAWQAEIDKCEALAAAGGFFHFMEEGDGKAALEADRDEYYEQFISLKYGYSAVELDPRPGYTIHGSHTDDIPIEIKTVTSSEYKDYSRAGKMVSASGAAQSATPSNAVRISERNFTFISGRNEENPDKSQKNIQEGIEENTSDADQREEDEAAATPSDASPSTASASNAVKVKNNLLMRLKELFEAPFKLLYGGHSTSKIDDEDDDGSDLVSASFEPSEVSPVTPGSSDIIDHTFLVYDHRTEGEIHINKRDLYLQRGENDVYNAYGDSMGDGTLEGALYGLFALKDIIHPDGHTGVVFKKDNLVSVAAADRNGDASFMAVTEQPGMTYNYETGRIEKAPGNFEGPDNLHQDEANNGNCWIGRPLIVEENGTTYYVKELTRSEGYELSVNGKTNAVTNGQHNYDKEYMSADVTIGKITLDISKGGNYFDIAAAEVDHDIILQGLDFPEGAAFMLSAMEKVPEKITVPVYTTVKKPVMAAAGFYVYRAGKKVEAGLHDRVTFPNGQSYAVNSVSAKTDKTMGVKPLNYHTLGTPTVTDLHSGGEAAVFRKLYNEQLDKLGYKEPGNDAPWVRVKLDGMTDTGWLASITAAIIKNDLQYFNSLRITDIVEDGGESYAIMCYEWNLYGDSRDSGIYVPVKDRLYIKRDSGNGYFVYAAYDGIKSHPAVISYSMKDGFLERAVLKDQKITGLTVSYPEPLPGSYVLKTQQIPSYWTYAAGEQEIGDDGGLKTNEVTEVTYVEQDGFKMVEKNIGLISSYQPENGTYTMILPAEAFNNMNTVSLKVCDDGSGKYSIRQAYINGSTLVYTPMNQSEDSYMVNVTLTVPPVDIPYQDGGTRTEAAKILERPIMQKVKITKDIEQNGEGIPSHLPNFRFKIYQKTNLEQLYRTENGTITWQDRNGNTVDIGAYRFVYPEKVQKLYTVVDHAISPLVRQSNNAVMANNRLYSYTDGLIHEDSNTGYTAVLETVAKTVEDGNGNRRQIERYNYEKFFGAIKTANNDKWDRVEDSSTSFKPFAFIKELLFGISGAKTQYPAGHNNPDTKNEANTSPEAKENSKRSDNVRQFAITWYLDDEVKKLVDKNASGETQPDGGSQDYQDEVYDKALFHAIRKAENYLRPFFAYDLDEIYAIEWDSEAGGGKDKDRSTLSADLEDAGGSYCYGISEYLPYGTYVAVEQQPFDKDLDDLYNKHYKTDEPKEIDLPAVYEGGKSGSDQTPEVRNPYYNYSAADTVDALSSKYHIRFNEEWSGKVGEDLRKYVIKAHGYHGDYEIYKYGLDLDKLDGTAAGDASGSAHFKITQGLTDPVKDYYNTIVDSEEEGGNPDSHYLADDINKGMQTASGTGYAEDAIEKKYHYGSVSEDRRTYNNVAFPAGDREEYRDGITAMEGMQTAYDGKYASMLVPWTVTEPVDELEDVRQNADGTSNYQGYGYRRYRNTFYTGKLRIEKLDSETGENILHDGAFFALYEASRENGQNTDGLVQFYEKETLVKGSKEFLEAMGAANITPAARAAVDIGNLWTGYVPAGTPICSEDEQVILADQEGRRTGEFEAFTTTRDGLQADEENSNKLSAQDQNTGYLNTPQPLGAGTYVLCEIKPPSGYARTKPVAIEIYSDKVSYYLDGNRDERVTAAVYEQQDEDGFPDGEDTARIYVGNTPIRLEVSKIKVKDQTVTYKTSTRVEGSLTELKARYGNENLEFGYKNGTYLGYAWYKGTLEYLESRRAAGEAVEPVYIDGVFAGYGLITRTLDTADDENRYAAGAQMTLYDAIEIKANGDSGDYGYDGVKVERDRNSNVQSMKVLEGYAGETVEFIKRDEVEESLAGAVGDGTWTYQTIPRKATDILYYSLADLKVTETGTDGKVYGYDRDGHRILARNQTSIFAMKNGRPIFEITGGDLEKIRYSPLEQYFAKVNPETIIYHLDEERNRDSLVHPTTGMAYVTGKDTGKIFVWPVNISKTANGAVIAREKIDTYRIASINADTKEEYTIGTYDGNSLKKQMNPVLDSHGFPVYYQRSGQIYTKGVPVYDIDGDYVRYRYDDMLPAFNRAAYRINNSAGLHDIGNEQNTMDDARLYRRQGEAYVMKNTWMTGEKYPNDPFLEDMTTGQADMLKRVIPGNYIMEESKAPRGYVKNLPAGVVVRESTKVQISEMADEKIKVEIVKTDAADQYKLTVKSDYQGNLTVTEPKGAYGYGQIPGAHLVLYNAKRVYTTDSINYPKGYYLEKTENKPAEWTVESTVDNSPVKVVADWITDGTPMYFEGIPAGDYILEELEAGSGYIRKSAELEIKASGEVQTINVKDDHTKLEIYKYYIDEDGKKTQLSNDRAAGLALYEAVMDKDGNIVMVDGIPQYDKDKKVDQWTTDDLTQYTSVYEKSTKLSERAKHLFGLSNNQSSFLMDFERAYKREGAAFTHLTWYTAAGERRAHLISSVQTGQHDSVTQVWMTDEGKNIRVTIYRDGQNGGLDEQGQLPLKFEYQFNYKVLPEGVKNYDTLEGMHRIDYLPFHGLKNGEKEGNYVLVEEAVPSGFAKAAPKAITITETGAVQRFSLENEEQFIHVIKKVMEGNSEYDAEGVKLGLYRGDEEGNFLEDEEHLVEMWISGGDGRYDEEDRFNGSVLSGFNVGDMRPHKISGVEHGIYYIAELEVPEYMAQNEPMRIEVTDQSTAVYKVVNRLSTGRLEILKKGSDDGLPLENARFEVENIETGVKWYMTTGRDGKAVLEGLSVGKRMADGTVKPYTYMVKEVNPPDYYRITGGPWRFQFDGKGNQKIISYKLEIENQPTQIHFRKTDFDTGILVKGAVIELYKAKLVDGIYKKDGEPIEELVTTEQGFTITKKLMANHVYVLEEIKAPEGMAIAKPVVFTVNAAGTGIQDVTSYFGQIKLAAGEAGIESLTVKGRVPTKVFTVWTDLDTGKELPEIISTGVEVVLTEADGIADGHLYEIKEYTRYSDGNAEVSSKETKRIHLDEKGRYAFWSRTFGKTEQKLTEKNGKLLAEWQVDDSHHQYTIHNPVTKEPVIAEVVSEAGKGHSAVKTGDVIKYQIMFFNPYDEPMQIKGMAVLGEGLEYMRSTGDGKELEGTVVWQIADVAPHTGKTVELVAAVRGKAGTMAKVSAATVAGEITHSSLVCNPVAPAGSITIMNKLTGTGKDMADEFTYRVHFADKDGNLLKGYQHYTGSKSGRIKGEGTIDLAGDEFVTFTGLPYGIFYEIVQEPSSEYDSNRERAAGEIERAVKTAVFQNNRNDDTIRDVLTAGGHYMLTESTDYRSYRDGDADASVDTSRISGIYRFIINEQGILDNVDMEDKPLDVYFSKVDIDTDEEIAGGHYSLIQAEDGRVIYSFTKEEKKPVRIPAKLLIPGKEYILREDLSPTGYAYETEIRFTVDQSGAPEVVVMQDQKTEVWFSKTDITTGEELTGGHYTVKDVETGEIVADYIATGEKICLKGALTAGKTYEFKEDLAPIGYAYAESVLFTVPKEPGKITVGMKDKPTQVKIEKLAVSVSDTDAPDASPSDADRPLAGAVLQILYTDGKPVKAVRDFDQYKAGEDLIFTTTSSFTSVAKQLEAGKSYLLHEIKPRDGYAYAEDVPFTVSRDGTEDSVIMYDKPTDVIFSKKEITGEEELPGNQMSVRDESGKIVEEWISSHRPHRIVAKLIAGKQYFLREDCPADGFAYAKMIPFTVSLDGSIDKVIMRNDRTKIRIRKVDESGDGIAGAVLQVLNARKEVVIRDFVTDGKPVDITGKLHAGQTYYLHEVSAPAGYLLAADIPFRVPWEAELLEVVMVDPKRQEPEPEDKHMVIKKTDAKTGESLEGFEFTIFKPDGTLYLRVVTGTGGNVSFPMPPDGVYTYRETKAGPGYWLSDETFSFTIRAGCVTDDSTVLVADQPVSEEESKIGTITAVYIPHNGEGVLGASMNKGSSGKKTGDDTLLWPWIVIMAICVIGGGITIKKHKNTKIDR